MSTSITAEERKNYVDLDAGLARVRGNAAIYKKMLGLFEKSEEFAAFEEAIDKKDYKRAGEVAHGIKGMTGNLAFTRVFELSTQLMDTLRTGNVPSDALLDEYRSALNTTREVVREVEAGLA